MGRNIRERKENIKNYVTKKRKKIVNGKGEQRR